MTQGAELAGAKVAFIDDLPGYAMLSVDDIIFLSKNCAQNILS
jgi:hypothetical protein